jgi:hypothetical protein
LHDNQNWKPKLWSFDEFTNEPLTAGKWLIPGLLPAESIVLLSGLPKQGFKTWLALWLATMVAGRRGYASKEKGGIWRQPVRAGRVLVFEEEGAHIASKERLCKVGLGLGLPIRVTKHLLQLPEGIKEEDPDRPYDWRVKILDSADCFFANFKFSHGDAVKLDIESKFSILRALVKEIKPDLVVFDPWTYALTGDENEKRDVSKGVDAIKELRRMGASVMALVHLNKDGGDDPDVDKGMRGHTVLRDCYDLHLACRRPKDRDIIALHCRYRDSRARKYELFWHIPDEGTMGPAVLDIKEVASKPKRKGLESTTPEEVVQKLLDFGIIRGAKYTGARFNEIWGVSPGRGTEIRAELIKSGLVEIAQDGKVVLK